MNVEPEFYGEKLKLFVALAPTVMLDHCKEQALIKAAEAEELSNTILSTNFLEYNGKDRDKPDELKQYIW